MKVNQPVPEPVDPSAGRIVYETSIVAPPGGVDDPGQLASDAIRRMRRLEGGPFAMLVSFSTACAPYAPHAPDYQRFTDPSYRGLYKYDAKDGAEGADARDQAQIRALYAAAIASVDDAAQSILEALAGDGLANRTIVVVTSGHGEALFEHGRGRGQGEHLSGDEGTHVPLVIVDPRHASPGREARVVRDVDLAPTLYELMGVAPPAVMDGASLVALGGVVGLEAEVHKRSCS